jgi:probable rRNA maturation factor
MKRNQNIKFFFNNVTISLGKREDLKKKFIEIFSDEKKTFSNLSFIFCSDKYLLSINNKFLGHNTYTDIITFPFNEKHEPISGEIYISVDRVRENALKEGCSIKNELHRVLFHGVLHLCGYKDKTRNDKILMTSKENFYLQSI